MDEINGRTPWRRLAWLAVHVCVLAALFAADGPIEVWYRNVYHSVYRARTRKVLEKTNPDREDASVTITIRRPHQPPEEYETTLSPGADIKAYLCEDIPQSTGHRLAKRILAGRFWDFVKQFGAFYAAIVAFVIVAVHDPKRRRYFVAFVMAAIVSALAVWFIQRMAGRLRPAVDDTVPRYLAFLRAWVDGGSVCFPSGHTAFAFTLCTFLAFVYPRLAWLFFFLAAATGVSRFLAQAHWPSDVYAGALVGYGISRWFCLWFCRAEEAILARVPGRLRKWVSGG